MRTILWTTLVAAALTLVFAAPARAEGRTIVPQRPVARPDPAQTTCRRDFGWYPTYRFRCAPPGKQCAPPTWRAPYYRRANYCTNWYGPRCYGRPFPSRQPRSAYYRQVMGR
jgi:hypothetical protein